MDMDVRQSCHFLSAIFIALLCVCLSRADGVSANVPVEVAPSLPQQAAETNSDASGASAMPAERVQRLLNRHEQAAHQSATGQPEDANALRSAPRTESAPSAAGVAPAGADQLSVPTPSLESMSNDVGDAASPAAGTLGDLMRQSGHAPQSSNAGGSAGSGDITGGLPGGTGSGMLSTLSALGVIIGLILLLRWGWSKANGGIVVGSSQVVEVLSRTTVAPKNHVLILRIGSRMLVVNDSAAGMRTLTQIDEPEEVADLLAAIAAAKENSMTNNFNRLLSRFNGDYDRQRDLAEGTDDQEHQFDRARDSLTGVLSRIRNFGSTEVSHDASTRP